MFVCHISMDFNLDLLQSKEHVCAGFLGVVFRVHPQKQLSDDEFHQFGVLLCRWCRPCLKESQPCLWNQHMAVELWTAPAQRGRPLCVQNWEDQKEIWGCQTRLGNKDCAGNLKWLLTGIYMVYIRYILVSSKTYLLGTIELLSCNIIAVCMYFLSIIMLVCRLNNKAGKLRRGYFQSNFYSFHVSVPKLKIAQNGICIAYTMHIPSICKVYAMKSCWVIFKDNYAMLKSSSFYIWLPSTMASSCLLHCLGNSKK